jgi:hypothetical protein
MANAFLASVIKVWARITGDDYFAFIEQFVDAVKGELPETCLQWEDCANPHAISGESQRRSQWQLGSQHKKTKSLRR